MTVWTDAQVPPAWAGWLRCGFGVDAHAVRGLGLREAEDPVVFARARAAGAVVLAKDGDFGDLLERHCGSSVRAGGRRRDMRTADDGEHAAPHAQRHRRRAAAGG